MKPSVAAVKAVRSQCSITGWITLITCTTVMFAWQERDEAAYLSMRTLHAPTVLHTRRVTWATRIQSFRQIYFLSTWPAYSAVTLRKPAYKCITKNTELIDTNNLQKSLQNVSISYRYWDTAVARPEVSAKTRYARQGSTSAADTSVRRGATWKCWRKQM